ncbi:MAG: hypothetical protein C5B50_06790 [Verrucomicrobia bacterium]|nr:MAG: hypothetical protein C5B50_06790 [Verrucomicrobiota bacterium]
MPTTHQARSRYIGWLLFASLALLWVLGLRDSVLGGLNPGYTRNRFRPYPLHDVLVVSTIITVETVLLLGILRPWSFNLHRRRIFASLYLSVPLLIADFVLFSGATDQAGYSYSNGFFLLLTNTFLGLLAIMVAAFSRAY